MRNQRFPWLALAGVLISCAVVPTAFAALGVPVQPTIKGTIQNIDYLHHAITVNDRTYFVAPRARFNGVAGFSILHVGMSIAYTLNRNTVGTDATDSGINRPSDHSRGDSRERAAPTITSITWLPMGS